MMQVSIPITVPLKGYDHNTEIELVNSIADTVNFNKGSII